VARVFQTPEIFADLSLIENVKIPAFAKRDGAFRLDLWSRVDTHAEVTDHAEAVLEDVGLADKRHMHAGSLSRGDKRRLELAMCLVQDPKLLLLDEPTAGMSRADTNATIDLLQRIGERGITKIVIEHDMAVVETLSAPVAVMIAGRIVAHGDYAAVRADPAVRAAYFGKAGAASNG
jgi:branched-chain amino acid transport system ATP-binding protein